MHRKSLCTTHETSLSLQYDNGKGQTYLKVVGKSRQVSPQPQVELPAMCAELDPQVGDRARGAPRAQMVLVYCARVIVERLVVLNVFV